MHQRASNQEEMYLSETRFLFYCHVKVKVPVRFGADILQQSFELLANIDKTYNSFQSGSYFDKINKNAGNWVAVDLQTIELLKNILRINDLSDGAYHIAVLPLLRLWGFFEPTPLDKKPTSEALKEVTDKIQKQKIEINGLSVRISPDMELTTGSFIKAFAVDQLCTFLRDNGVDSALINAGGSTIAGINEPLQAPWFVNVPHPTDKDKAGQLIALHNKCFSLSANRDHKVVINGESFGHVLNAKTGHPTKNKQAGVLASSAFWSDLISTALLAMDSNELPSKWEMLNQSVAFDTYVVSAQWDEITTDSFFINHRN